MEKLRFENGDIFLGEEYIGLYDYKDENSDFNPSKEKIWWATIFEHEFQSDDFKWYDKNLLALKSRVRKYLENREKGIKDLPQISDQIKRIVLGVHETAARKFANEFLGYYSAKSGEWIAKTLKRLNLLENLKSRGYWLHDGYKLVPRDIYEII